MFSSEIKETIYVAISLFLAAMVLGLISFVIGLRGDIATLQNTENSTRISMENYQKFNKYSGQLMYGEDVLTCIREFAGTDTVVCVKNLRYENGISNTCYYLDKRSFLNNDGKFTTVDYLETYNGGIKRDATYYAYLVFSDYTQNEIQNAKYNEVKTLSYGEVTAVKLICVHTTGRYDLSNSTVQSAVNRIISGSLY